MVASAALALSALAPTGGAAQQVVGVAPGVYADQSGSYPLSWRQHEATRPYPAVVRPAAQPGAAPSDAVVLFAGRDLSEQWETNQGRAPNWIIENGYAEIPMGGGSIRTKKAFGDVQLHIEWAAPAVTGPGQSHSNSGVTLLGQYEFQILDSYNYQDTYVDGTGGSIYGQYPPLVNAALPTGQFNVMDLYFRRPRFRPDGTLAEAGRATIVMNGVLIQNNEIILGATAPEPPYQYRVHPDSAPISIQDHGQALRFRNIWARPIRERPEPPAGYVPRPANLTTAQLDRFVGTFYSVGPGPGAPRYGQRPAPAQNPPATPPAGGGPGGGPGGGFGGGGNNPAFTITRNADQILVRIGAGTTTFRAVPVSETRLWLPGRARDLTFTFDESGKVTNIKVSGTGADLETNAAPRP